MAVAMRARVCHGRRACTFAVVVKQDLLVPRGRILHALLRLQRVPAAVQRQRLADAAFRRGGVTFSVYSDRRGIEKTFPFDLIPRVIAAGDWAKLERGLL